MYDHVLKWLEKIAETRWNYFFSMLIDLVLLAIFVGSAVYLNQTLATPAPFYFLILFFLLGNLIQSFQEYFFHRWVFHHFLRNSKGSHNLHHTAPTALLSLPWFLTVLDWCLFWGFFFLISLGDPTFAGMTAGGVLWRSIAYTWLHHSFHHIDLQNRLWRRMRAYHFIHHRLPDRNFGVSSTFWDRVLRTHYKSQRYESRTPA